MRKYEVSINDKQYSVTVKKYTSELAELEINGKPYSVKLDGPITDVVGTVPLAQNYAAPVGIQAPPPQMPVSSVPATPSPAPAAKPAATGANSVCAPIPGSVLEIVVKVGDKVTEGQLLLTMEAMKMENEINAASDGTVTAIAVNVGDSVNQGATLVELG